jgi:hypothetical protein
VPFDLFDDVLLLDLALETAERIFQRFAFLEFYFSQSRYTSQPNQKFPALRGEGTDIIGG